MRRVLIVAGVLLAAVGAGTASASFMITSVRQIAPAVRARLVGINETGTVVSKEKHVCVNGSCPAAAVAYAYCPKGTVVTGGGFFEAAHATFASTTGASAPVHTSHGSGWGALLGDIGKTNGAFYAEVVCGAHRSAGASDAGASNAGSLSQLQMSLIKSLRH